MDINPFGHPSCSLLFEWGDFVRTSCSEATLDESKHTIPIDFRVVRSPSAVLKSAAGASRGPVDIHLSPDFPNFMELARRQQQDEEKSSEDD